MHCRLGFLLVAALPWHHHHLALASLSTRSSSSSEDSSAAASSSSSVAWSSPAPGDRFGPGDAIVGKWRVTAGPKVVSPSFRLCAGGEDGCGATVWPEIVEESTGTYHASLTAPNVSTESAYCLQMKDDFGHTFSSPIFNLAPTQVETEPAENPPEVAQPRPDQAPMSSPSSSGPKSKGGAKSDPAAPAVAGPADPRGTLSPPSAAGVPANAVAPWPPGSGGGEPLVAARHSAPPTAALAVPLSLAGAIVLLAGGLALHHRRQLAAEKERCYRARQDGLSSAQVAAAAVNTTTVTTTGNAPSDSEAEASRARMRSLDPAFDLGRRRSGRNDHDDVEKALFARAALLRGRRRFPDRAYEHHAYYAPSCAYSAPERRQRTRHLDPDFDFDLDLHSRELHTRRRPRALANPSHPSLSSHASPHRGLWGNNRHSVRRSTASKSDINGGGGGSLWRSLSIARRKPPSALASPAMTESVASVTSEVLPSYLPSPNFAGVAGQMRECEHGTSIGDFGFENIPLSPPPPPPLHTRGEATEPDDLRMRELRGVYEAVARALGTVRGV